MPTTMIGVEHFAAPILNATNRARRAVEAARAGEAMLSLLHQSYDYLVRAGIETEEVQNLRARLALVIVQAEQAGYTVG